MKDKNKTVITEESKELVPVKNDVLKPQQDTAFAHASAQMLMDIVKKNNWAKKLGGSQDHLQYEAWQTVGKYYGYTVKTGEAESVEIGGVVGFKAKAKVINEYTGIEIGGAEAYCMKDENNWKSKPLFQLASMAQTRAGSKALRQILGFVVALAGYNPTPAEEMIQEAPKTVTQTVAPVSSQPKAVSVPQPITQMQKEDIMVLLGKNHKTPSYLNAAVKKAFKKDSYQQLTQHEASTLIEKMQAALEEQAIDPEEKIDIDEVDKKMSLQRSIN